MGSATVLPNFTTPHQ